MRQVLFSIPIGEIAAWLPDLHWLVYVALGMLAIGVGSWLDRRRNEATRTPSHAFRLGGTILGVLLIFAGIVVLVAPNNPSVPIYGYGAMLFVAFVSCVALASWLGLKEGIPPSDIQDMAIWMFLVGIIGARLTFMFLAAPNEFEWVFPTIIFQFCRVWDGGLVFYGSAIGGLVGYALAYRFVLRKHGISSWKMADIVAPCIALGLALGRVGCLLNGCCYGNVAVCEHCPGIRFPMTSPPRYEMTRRGYQTAAGFLLEHGDTVTAVDPTVRVNLKLGDVLLKVNGKTVDSFDKDKNVRLTVGYLLSGEGWPRGKNDLELRVSHANKEEEDLHLRPLTVPLHPTQIYETISMLFVLLLLLAYYPLRRQPGAVMVLLMFCYGAHRFVNEMLRTDTERVALHMTLSQNLSLLVIGIGVVLALWLRIKTIRGTPSAPPPLPASLQKH